MRVRTVVVWWQKWLLQRQTQKILSALSESQLRDIGLTRYDIKRKQ
ncbi:hypothetical protein CIG19_20760 [Enterobacterales bacterium CwR94]|nr:hypothetical protein CIG19_20760 [Enterobacterales bacterium CwR94]